MIIIRFLFLLFFVQGSLLSSKELQVSSLHSLSAILINARTGKVLYAKNPDRKLYPASITKVATALYVLQKHSEDQKTQITAPGEALVAISTLKKKNSHYSLPSYWLEFDSSHIGLKPGEKMGLEDLLGGLLIPSGNDAANVLALYSSGSIVQFMEELNAYLKSLGCQETFFLNPHGLHHPKHLTTARDMSLIAKEAMKYPLFREIVRRDYYKRPKTNKQEEAFLSQTNRLLKEGSLFYPEAVGVKTGYTQSALNTLIAAAEKDNRLLIAVLMYSKDRDDKFKDAIHLFEKAFSEKRQRKILMKAGKQDFYKVLKQTGEALHPCLSQAVEMEYYPSEEEEIKPIIRWLKTAYPIYRGQKVAEVRFVRPDQTIYKKVDLYSDKEYQISTLGFLYHLWQHSWFFSKFLSLIFLCSSLVFLLSRLLSRP